MRRLVLLSLLLFLVACQQAPTDTPGAAEEAWPSAISASVDPGCTNGDCPPPDPGCTNGDCPPPDPGCNNGDCPPPNPGCSNGDCPQSLVIDIKPGSDPNSINCTTPALMIPVAILTTEAFDATTVDHTTVTFEGASEAHLTPQGVQRHEMDVDGDGDVDLVFHFLLGDTGLTCSSTEGALTGLTFDGQTIWSMDSVNMIGG